MTVQGKLLAANNVRPEDLPTLSNLRKMGLLPPESPPVPPPMQLSQPLPQQSLFSPVPSIGLGGLPGLSPLLFPMQQPQLQQHQQQQQLMLQQQLIQQQQQLQGLGLPPPNTMFGPLGSLSQQIQGCSSSMTFRPSFQF